MSTETKIPEAENPILASTPESREKEDNAFTRFARKYQNKDQGAQKDQGEARNSTPSKGQNPDGEAKSPVQGNAIPAKAKSTQPKDHESLSEKQKPRNEHSHSEYPLIEEPIEILERIKAYKAQTLRGKGKQKAPSNRVVLGAHHDIQALVCAKTGAAYGLLMPSIKGFALEFDSPFASYENCRGLAQQGAGFLRMQNAQIIAAILITLAENYNLLSYRPTDTGAQKNAVLRMAERDTMIDAILLLESWVNTGNASYLPRLSLLLDAEPNNMEHRMRGWLSSCVDAIYKPDRTSYEEAVTVKRSIEVKTTAAAARAKLALKKEYRAWKKMAKEHINSLFSQKLVSLKLKTYFLAMIQDEAILEVDPNVIDIMGNRLQQMDSPMANALGMNLLSFHRQLTEAESEDVYDNPQLFASQPPGSSLEEKEEEAEDDAFEPLNSDNAFVAKPSALQNGPQNNPQNDLQKEDSIVEKPAEKLLSFTERLLLKKAQQKLEQNQAAIQNNQEGGNNDAPF